MDRAAASWHVILGRYIVLGQQRGRLVQLLVLSTTQPSHDNDVVTTGNSYIATLDLSLSYP